MEKEKKSWLKLAKDCLKKKANSLVKEIQGCFCLKLSRNVRFESEFGNTQVKDGS